MKRLLQLTLVLLITAGLTSIANAQSADINASADVQAPISVTGESDLTFGNIIQGNSKTVGYHETNAGRFLVTGTGSSNVSISFSALPSNLTDGSGNNLPITYDTAWDDATSVTSGGGTTFTASSGDSFNLPTDGDFSVFVGGTADASASPPAGNYEGTITLTASYN